MKRPETDKDLTDLIVGTLKSGEELYILGSWEKFVKTRKRKRRMLLWFTISGLAACLLSGWIGFRLFFDNAARFGSEAPRREYITGNIQVQKEAESEVIESVSRNIPGYVIPNPEIIADQDVNAEKVPRNDDQHIPAFVPHKVLESVKPVFMIHIEGYREIKVLPFEKEEVSIIKTNPVADIEEVHAGKEDIEEKKSPGRKITLAFSVSPGMTSTSSNSSFSYSGGINAEIGLSHRFSLSTGLQFEQCNVANTDNNNPAWIPAGKSEARLAGIDLPVNIRWKFRAKRTSGYYVSAGLSSVAWLGEKYINTSYTQKMVEVVSATGGEQSVSYELETIEKTSEDNEKPLSTIDLAGRANLIFGFEQKLSPAISLYLEPYIKIPLSGAASRNLHYTISGITCKVSF